MESTSPFAAAILLAGGSGTRMTDATTDKVLFPIKGKPTLQYSIDAFAESEAVDSIVIVYRDGQQRHAMEAFIPSDKFSSITWAQGGAERQDSVWAGLCVTPTDCEVVLIHDGARPMVTPTTIDAVAQSAKANQVACVAKRATDTIKQATPSDNGYTLRTLDRSNIWSMETPQAFKFSLIKAAYKTIIANGQSITDDLSAIEKSGQSVQFIENPIPNIKITTPKDIPLAEYLLTLKDQSPTV
ncbi:MAG: 2-C-methyl-D-erythritol 4-phosphate cytidylyltransferase [Opitutaceae bacterium]|nr:2-C-methyl-D-erythritol 4-phosphate cytidylyltransferase [Opitutaceae bacterium]